MDSILTSIKKLLGITEEYTHFDQDIIMHINSVFSMLTQMGVGPESGFRISDKNATWDEFVGDTIKIEMVKSYAYAKVRLMFDPPSNGSLTESLNNIIREFEWRLNVECDDWKGL